MFIDFQDLLQNRDEISKYLENFDKIKENLAKEDTVEYSLKQRKQPFTDFKGFSLTGTSKEISHQTVDEPNAAVKSYLNDKSANRSQAGYSISYDRVSNKYKIGNGTIEFNGDKLIVTDKDKNDIIVYDGTNGLMELLTKKTPNESIISEEDYENYKQILGNTNAIYKGFTPESKSFIADSSKKFKIIKEKLFPEFNIGKKKKKVTVREKTIETFEPKININTTSEAQNLLDTYEESLDKFLAGNAEMYENLQELLPRLLNSQIITGSEYKEQVNILQEIHILLHS